MQGQDSFEELDKNSLDQATQLEDLQKLLEIAQQNEAKIATRLEILQKKFDEQLKECASLKKIIVKQSHSLNGKDNEIDQLKILLSTKNSDIKQLKIILENNKSYPYTVNPGGRSTLFRESDATEQKQKKLR